MRRSPPRSSLLAASLAASVALHAALAGAIALLRVPGPRTVGPALKEGDEAIEVHVVAEKPRTHALPEPPDERPAMRPVEPRVPAVREPSALPAPEALPAQPPIPESPREAAAEAPPLPPPPEGPAPQPPGRRGVRTAARRSSEVVLDYPERCRRLGHEGLAEVGCRLDAQGGVIEVRIVRSAGCEDLDRAALEALRRARFEPCLDGGRPAECDVVQPVRFELRKM
ncbi:MAG: energy transducer TonB [Planctomycetes bacterium]|nr:energy transducer TonB [Planctomycetota bacterium]